MRAVFFVETFPPAIGGIESFAARLLPALRERGHDLVVLTSQLSPNDPDGTFEGIPVHRLPMRQALSRWDLPLLVETRDSFARICRSFRPDLIHVNISGPTIFFWTAVADRLGVPSLLSTHGRPFLAHTDENSVTRKALAVADWVTGCSSYVLGLYQAILPSIRPRSSVIYYGLEDPKSPPRPPTAGPELLWLGRMSREKGGDLALRAFARVLDRVPGATLTMAGDGPERPALEALARKIGIFEHVSFAGRIPANDVAGLISRHSLLVVSSRWEGFGYVVIEAALRQRSAVGFRVEGLPEAIKEDETGVLVAAEDTTALADAIHDLLISPERLRKLGEAAYERAVADFTLTRMVDQFEHLYHQVARSADREANSAG